MLHARLEIAQILDMFEVRAVITEFQAGTDPVVWESTTEAITLSDEWEKDDALSTTLNLIRIWSERTIQQ